MKIKSVFSAIVVSGGSSGALGSLLFLLVVGICLGIIWYLISIAPFLNDVFKKVLSWLIIFIGALILINVLLGLVGHPIIAIN